MIPEFLIQTLENTPFQLKLFVLATCPEVTYIQWSKCGNTVIVDSIEIINEGCASLIFNVDNFEQLLQSFSQYNFEIINKNPGDIFQRTEENAEFECQNAGQSTTYEAVDKTLSMQQSQEQTEKSDTLSANDTANNPQTAVNLFDGK
ncbi:hypothetical protein CEXT_592391 [Caerostris extrusa]|uniref:HSF-type DNA-binding domain-containing protein n=1 Tax=Caerostris extrusa TaxID=172846 RepID=A0AAV4UW41_CAEEX|nr:hypothetical protein CEXT_592391 [Caerostris extrusa]